MTISREEVEQVARNSRLELTEEEKEIFTQRLNAILQAAGKLTQLDTQGVEPTVHVQPLKNVFREDVVQPGLSQEQALENAPEQSGGFFTVPKIV